MDYFSLIVGIAAIAYGIYGFMARLKNPDNKLTILKKKMSDRGRLTVYTLFYTVIPIMLGVILIAIEFILRNGNN